MIQFINFLTFFILFFGNFFQTGLAIRHSVTLPLVKDKEIVSVTGSIIIPPGFPFDETSWISVGVNSKSNTVQSYYKGPGRWDIGDFNNPQKQLFPQPNDQVDFSFINQGQGNWHVTAGDTQAQQIDYVYNGMGELNFFVINVELINEAAWTWNSVQFKNIQITIKGKDMAWCTQFGLGANVKYAITGLQSSVTKDTSTCTFGTLTLFKP